MKKIIFMLAALVFCFQIAGISQTRVGISGGASFASMKGNVEGDSRRGIMAGLVLETPLGKTLAFRPSLSYVQKGQTRLATGLVDELYVALRYAELTLDFLANTKGVNGGFFIGAGPSIDFNLPSKIVSVTNDQKSITNIKFGKSSGNDMRGVDFGVNFTAGIRSKGGFLLSVNYNKGLRNLVIEGASGSIKNQYFGIQLGVFLNNVKSTKK